MNNDRILIGLAGRKGSGKSTLAGILAEMLGDTRIVAFADALKDDVLGMVHRTTGRAFTRDDMEREKAHVWGPILQGYGELYRRHFGPDYWVDRLAATLPDRAIVADVRFPNEAAFIKVHDGLIVYVDGPDRRDGDARSPAHISEAMNEKPWGDLKVRNHGTVQQLRAEARDIARIAETLRRSRHMVGAR